MKKTRIIFGITMFVIFVLISCNKDNDKPANLQLIVRSSYTPATVKTTENFTIELDDVYVNLREIEFKLDESEYEHHNNDTIVSELELEGPFAITILKDGILQTNDLVAVTIPPAAYDKVEFKIDKNTTLEEGHPLYNHSLYISGKINDFPFLMWQDAKAEVEIEFPDNSSMEIGTDLFNLFIDCHTEIIINGMASSALMEAVDGNENGIIEIGPDDTDGNNEIAYLVLHYFKHSFDLDDDDDNSNDHHSDGEHSEDD